MIKKISKISLIVFGLLTIFLIFNGASCSNSITETIISGDPAAANQKTVSEAVTKFASVLAGAASTVTLIYIIIGGIQYITAAGNAEQAQKAKSTLTWAVIGFILIIASYSIVLYFINFVNSGALPGQ